MVLSCLGDVWRSGSEGVQSSWFQIVQFFS